MRQTGILMSKETTFTEYTDDLLDFQGVIVPIVMGNEYQPGMRVEEAIFKMEKLARAKELSGDPIVRKGINSLKTVNKELHICMAGRKGENLVARTLEFINRPEAKVYRNVYISDGKEETELDAVVTTNTGTIILEIKKSKDDLTITEDGRLVHSGDECYEKRPIGEKMEMKRRLLRNILDLECARRGFKEPVKVDSYIVFVTPKGVRIKVNDNYRQEKWCFRTNMNHIISAFSTDSYYREDQLEVINEAVENLEKQKKAFMLDVDYDSIREDFATAIEMLTESDSGRDELDFKERVVIMAKDFKESPFGKAIISASPFIIAELAGPAAGAIGKVAPKAAPYAAKVANGIRIAVSKVPVA